METCLCLVLGEVVRYTRSLAYLEEAKVVEDRLTEFLRPEL